MDRTDPRFICLLVVCRTFVFGVNVSLLISTKQMDYLCVLKVVLFAVDNVNGPAQQFIRTDLNRTE